MLGILHHLQALLGRRWYLVLVALAALGLFAYEYTGLGTAVQDYIIKAAQAPFAAPRASAEVDKLKGEVANLAQQNGVLIQQVAKLIEETRATKAQADNAPERAQGEAGRAVGEGALGRNRAAVAPEIVAAEVRKLTAEAEAKETEAARNRAETARAKAQEVQALADSQRALMEAEARYHECLKAGVIAGALTSGAGCLDPRRQSTKANGEPQSRAEALVQQDPRFAGFSEYPPEDGKGYIPTMTCPALFKAYIQESVKARAEPRPQFGAFAVNKTGGACSWIVNAPTQAAADAHVMGRCPKNSSTHECRIISRHTNVRRTSAAEPSAAQRMFDFNLCAEHKLMGGDSLLGGGPNCR